MTLHPSITPLHLLQLPLSLSQTLSARVLGQLLEVKLGSWVQTQVCLLCQALALVEMLQTGGWMEMVELLSKHLLTISSQDALQVQQKSKMSYLLKHLRHY